AVMFEVKKVSRAGMMTTVTGLTYSGPEDCVITSSASAVATDLAGNLFIADTGRNRILRVDARTSECAFFAGIVQRGQVEDITNPALFNCPEGVAVDAEGNLFVADSGNQMIRKVDAHTGSVSVVFDGSTLAEAFVLPRFLAVDSGRNIFFSGAGYAKVRKIT